ncbi:MAG: heparinase, partial [Alphaproteobacteria bacterium]
MASIDAVRPGWGGRLNERWRDLANALTTLRARLAPAPRAFVWQPQPRAVGSFARARQLCAGTFLFAGRLVQHSGPIWEVGPPSREFADALQAFIWMD